MDRATVWCRRRRTIKSPEIVISGCVILILYDSCIYDRFGVTLPLSGRVPNPPVLGLCWLKVPARCYRPPTCLRRGGGIGGPPLTPCTGGGASRDNSFHGTAQCRIRKSQTNQRMRSVSFKLVLYRFAVPLPHERVMHTRYGGIHSPMGVRLQQSGTLSLFFGTSFLPKVKRRYQQRVPSLRPQTQRSSGCPIASVLTEGKGFLCPLRARGGGVEKMRTVEVTLVLDGERVVCVSKTWQAWLQPGGLPTADKQANVTEVDADPGQYTDAGGGESLTLYGWSACAD